MRGASDDWTGIAEAAMILQFYSLDSRGRPTSVVHRGKCIHNTMMGGPRNGPPKQKSIWRLSLHELGWRRQNSRSLRFAVACAPAPVGLTGLVRWKTSAALFPENRIQLHHL